MIGNRQPFIVCDTGIIELPATTTSNNASSSPQSLVLLQIQQQRFTSYLYHSMKHINCPNILEFYLAITVMDSAITNVMLHHYDVISVVVM